MPNARARSLGAVNVVVSSDSADGTSSAANAPWQARAVISMAKLTDAPPMAETTANPASPVRNVTLLPSRSTRAPGHLGQKRDLPPQRAGQPSAEQQQAAERQRVGGNPPLPVHRREVQR